MTSKKQLDIIGWIASGMSLIGFILNAYQIIWCWVIWSIANTLWIYWSIKKKIYSLLVLCIIYVIANLYGWYQWSLL